ncbi:MAG: ATP-binding protein [Bacteroidales bacterium]|nr:ATP-binding protein [Bacteroidales bacterium]
MKQNEQKLISRNNEIERTHKELKASQNMMLHAEKLASVGQLAAGIAHEINTPIQFVGDNTRFLQDSFSDLFKLVSAYEELANAVNESSAFPELIGKVQTLSEEVEFDYLADEVPSAIKQSLEGVERVSKIVRSMKEFSHPGSDNIESIDLNRAIESTINVSRNEWKYVSEMVTDFDTSLDLVPCYPGEFNQVVLNMIVNAAHAIEDCRNNNDALGTINISTKLVDDDVEVRISDSGCGMSDEVKQRIFEPFFTTKGVGKGTGRGLAIAYSVIVDKHKGKVNVESEQGKGTTFIIRLPLVITAGEDETEIEDTENNLYKKGVA